MRLVHAGSGVAGSAMRLAPASVQPHHDAWRAQRGVLPLEDFNSAWQPAEPGRLAPVYVERVSIREALRGPLLPSLAANVELAEPTFQARCAQVLKVCHF